MGMIEVVMVVTGTRYRVTLSRRLASVDTVEWTGHALVAMQAAQRLRR